MSDNASTLRSRHSIGGPLVAAAAVTTISDASGFVWADAGIGAGITLASLLLLVATATVVRRYRHILI